MDGIRPQSRPQFGPTDRHAAQERLPSQGIPAANRWRRHTDTLIESLGVELGCDHFIVYAPQVFAERILPPAKEDADARAIDALVRPFLCPLMREGNAPRIFNRVRLKRDGPVLPYRIAVTPLAAADPGAGFLAALRTQEREPFADADLGILAAAAPKLWRSLQGRIDAGTGLLSWPAFEAEMSQQTRPRANTSVVYANLDQMHAVNDMFGFGAGDEVIRRVGRLWHAQLPAHSAVATHLSGDRFAVVLFDHTLNQARNWCEQAREAIATLALEGMQSGITASFGIVAAPAAQPFQHALAAAETACRVAKDRGRNRVEIYDSGDHTMIRRHEAVRESRALVDALEGDRLALHAQSIVALAPQARPYHYEILVRVQDVDGEYISIGGFLDAAERYQVLERLDRWVVSNAVRMLAPAAARLHALGASFSLNVTGQSLSEPQFADFLRTEIKRHNLPPGLIDFELTEIAAARNLNATRRFISRMAEIGSRVALDDFGTGVSSLVHLKDLDVFRIKIDGKFVRDILHNSRSRALIRALVQIADELGLDTVAEFVEDAAIATGVRDLGVHYAQGYFYSRARPLDEIIGELCAAAVPAAPALRAAASA